MCTGIEVRETAPNDFAAIEALYPRAFPDEDLSPIVRALLAGEDGVLSLTGVTGGEFAGHVLFTRCEVADCDTELALLAPLAIEPAVQRKGVGSALVRNGLERLKQAGTGHVFVLGDPAYYARFGFAPELAVAPPYPLPEEWQDAWQSVALSDGAPRLKGKLIVPPAWREPKLWAS